MQLPFTRYGAGEDALVLVHGWIAAAPLWNLILEALAPGVRSILVPDLRGAGLARTFAGPYDMDTAAADLLDTLDAARIRRAALVGHSMAGRIVLQLAAAAPERVESVVAVTPVTPRGVALDARGRAFYEAALDDDAALARLIGKFSAERYPQGWTEIHAALARAAMSRTAGAGYLDSFVAAEAGAATRVARPVLALCGAADRMITTASVAEALAPLCTSLTVAEMPASSHYPMLEAPLLFAATLNAWLADAALPGDVRVMRAAGD